MEDGSDTFVKQDVSQVVSHELCRHSKRLRRTAACR
jgi:hypothetical protein